MSRVWFPIKATLKLRVGKSRAHLSPNSLCNSNTGPVTVSCLQPILPLPKHSSSDQARLEAPCHDIGSFEASTCLFINWAESHDAKGLLNTIPVPVQHQLVQAGAVVTTVTTMPCICHPPPPPRPQEWCTRALLGQPLAGRVPWGRTAPPPGVLRRTTLAGVCKAFRTEQVLCPLSLCLFFFPAKVSSGPRVGLELMTLRLNCMLYRASRAPQLPVFLK